MKAERSSRTALMVTYARAVADVGASHVRDFRDPTARVFLSEKGLKQLARTEETIRAGRETATLAFARVSADLMALRTSTIDAAMRAAVSRGTKQIVILGAGLDGRAWRMNELAGLRVFEVDHPATQAFKRQHLAELPQSIARVTFVPIDFEHESLDAALARAGHDDVQPTCWIWEGVVMYLSPEVVHSTLAAIAGRSAKGSTLIVNYHTTMRRGLVRLIFRMLGEPVKSKWSPEEMAEALRVAGFGVIEDSGIEDWAMRFATGRVNVGAGSMMRIVVAQRS
ncbi:MAG: class I SAM-dependent methyltransferase [Gemmatimonadaceae bacterium]